ncbi:MAG: 8-amino-7-oxononanoate synthase [Myxococcota bacterium]|nr:8-amino-7-oxononanoate synthase [Myxococcota bacterium]
MNREELQRRAKAIENSGLKRVLVPLDFTGPTTARIDTREVQVFSSNDYLGLAWNPDVRNAWRGGGCGSSRLVTGSRSAHKTLESNLEDLFGQPALVFSSGYQANLAVLTTLFQAGDTVCSDELNHASLIDGLRLSKSTKTIQPHGSDPPKENDFRGLVTEGLFSMDGDTLSLRAWSDAGWLVVDEAHAVGAIGPGGKGVAAEQGVHPQVLIGTFGKAYGSAGAFVIGPEELKELMISTARSFVYTTALAEPAVHAAIEGLKQATSERRERLADRTLRFRCGLADLGLPTRGQHHIVPVLTRERTMQTAQRLAEHGVFVPGIRAPTVPSGEERLRFSMSAEHTDDQIDQALELLDQCT